MYTYEIYFPRTGIYNVEIYISTIGSTDYVILKKFNV